MARLIILTGIKTGQTVELNRDLFVIGREAACNLSIEDGTVSRRHAAIEKGPEGYVVRDLGSRNGIRVQGKKIEEARLTGGELIHVGSVQVRFVEDASASMGISSVEASGVSVSPGAPPAGARRRDLPGIFLGVGILVALVLLFMTLSEDKSLSVEVVVLAVDEERYFSFERPLRALGKFTQPNIAAVEGEPGHSAIVLVGLEEGKTDLPVELETESLILKIQVTSKKARKTWSDLAPEDVLPLSERLLAEGAAAAINDALMLVAYQKFQEAMDLLAMVSVEEASWAAAKDNRDNARRRLHALRQEHESAFHLALKQHNAHRAQGEAVWMLNLLDPAQEQIEYQKWTERMKKLGVSAAQIPIQIEKLRRSGR